MTRKQDVKDSVWILAIIVDWIAETDHVANVLAVVGMVACVVAVPFSFLDPASRICVSRWVERPFTAIWWAGHLRFLNTFPKGVPVPGGDIHP